MGITGFSTFMQQTFPQAYTALPKHGRMETRCDRLYVDCNDLLHQASRKASNDGELFAALFALLDSILALCRPLRSVMLALDGPGPYAKVITQRRRRAVGDESSGGRPSQQTKKRKRESSEDGRKQRQRDLKQKLTPGTELSQKLQSALLYWAELKLSLGDSRLVRDLAFFIGGSDIPGEGEVKILAHLYHFRAEELRRDMPSGAGAGGMDARRDRHLIVGGDADLLVMAVQADVPHVCVLQPDQATRGWRLFSADGWERAVAPALGFYPGAVTDAAGRDRTRTMRSARLDFALLSLLQGNDYLPKVIGARVAETWPRYVALRGVDSEFSAQTLSSRSTSDGEDDDALGGAASAAAGRSKWRRVEDEGRITGMNWAFLARVLRRDHPQSSLGGGVGGGTCSGADSGAGSGAGAPALSPESTSTSASTSPGSRRAVEEAPAARRRKNGAYLRGLLWCLNCYRTGLCDDYSVVVASAVQRSAADVLRLCSDAVAQAEIAADLRSAAGARDDVARAATALRPHELLLLLLPMSSRALLPAPLRSLVCSAKEAPLSELYAEEADANLASLRSASAVISAEAKTYRAAEKQRAPYIASARAALAIGKKAPKVMLPSELKDRLTASQKAYMAYKTAAHPPLDIDALVPKLRGVIATIPSSSYTDSELQRTSVGQVRCVALDGRAATRDERLRRTSWKPQPPPDHRFRPNPGGLGQPHAQRRRHDGGGRGQRQGQGRGRVIYAFDLRRQE